MIAGKILQKRLDELSEISRVALCVTGPEGGILASTMDEEISGELVASFVESGADFVNAAGNYLFKVEEDGVLTFVVICAGETEKSRLIGRIAAGEIKALAEAYGHNSDRDSFYQSLLTGNLLSVDIYNRARQLQIKEKMPRAVFVIEPVRRGEDSTAETLKALSSLLSGSPGDHVTAVDKDQVVLIKELSAQDAWSEIEETAAMLVDTMETEAMLGVRVASGGIAEELSGTPHSYKEALLTIEVGKLFYVDRNIFSYGSLGIGRLIYQLPVNLCEMFLHEIFGEEIPSSFDEETLATINTFLDNNLNVSETARKLYVHRNTLMYRLEKIEKATGLDIREFDDALTLKIAVMVMTYLDSCRRMR